jgi:hypothetical protein
MNVTIQFVFPGEGMNIDGQLVTPDTELMGDEQLDHLPGYKELREARRGHAR